jgi:hypothetical protein
MKATDYTKDNPRLVWSYTRGDHWDDNNWLMLPAKRPS